MIKNMNFEIPTVIDKIDDEVMVCYSAWPERLYHVDKQGIITYKGKPGPTGFDVKDFHSFLADRYLK